MNSSGWLQREAAGYRWIQSRLLDSIQGVRHLFSSRVGPDGDCDLGAASDPNPQLQNRRRGLQRAAGLAGVLLQTQQVHGDRLVDGSGLVVQDGWVEADGISIAAGSHQVATVRSADCVPLLIVDEGGRLALAVHAGWRGIVAGIVDRAVERARQEGIQAGALHVAMGPAAGGCCYEVSEEVRTAICRACSLPVSSGPGRIDLRSALKSRFHALGVGPEAVDIAPYCTICDPQLFFSFRRQGPAAGRMMAMVSLGEGASP